jgi:hypothetical protein
LTKAENTHREIGKQFYKYHMESCNASLIFGISLM